MPFYRFFFQAEDGIRDYKVTGVQTCALPISPPALLALRLLLVVAPDEGLVYFHNLAATAERFQIAVLHRFADAMRHERSEERRVGKGCGVGRSRAQNKDEKVRRRTGRQR